MQNGDPLALLIKKVGLFKRLRPKTAAQAQRFFYCNKLQKEGISLLSGTSCAERHKRHKAKYEALTKEGASPIDYEIAGCTACGTCEFGAIRAALLKKKRRKK